MKSLSYIRRWVPLLVFALLPALLGASGTEGAAPSMGSQMARVVLQLSIILLFTWLGGLVAKRLALPQALGYLFAGMVIGPFALGGLPLPFFPEGLFEASAGAIPVSPTLYVFSAMASIVLLFVSGLETDLGLFRKYAAKGAVVGIGGVIVSFAGSAFLTMVFTGQGLGSPGVLFMGALSTASSVGIAATILSARRKIDSPEGTVTLSAAVVDDILGIILLAVVLGITSRMDQGGDAGANAWVLVRDVALIALRAFGIWLVVTLLGLRFSKTIGKALKRQFKDRSQLAVMALGMAMLLAGLFEEAGLSMVIGAYIMGLALSNTDLAFIIQNKLMPIKELLVPVFFAVSGMLLNFSYIMDWQVIGFGILFSIMAVATKIIGSGGSSMLLGFNGLGALRIGFGMVPRAEVTLIIAGIGVSSGALDDRLFGAVLLMMVSTIIVAPPMLNLFLAKPASGQRKPEAASELDETVIDFQSLEFAELLVGKFMGEMEKEGFFVSAMEHGERLYQMRKDDIFVSMSLDDEGVAHIISEPEHVFLFKTALYESLLSVSDATADLKLRFKPEQMVEAAPMSAPANDSLAAEPAAKPLTKTAGKKPVFDLGPYMNPELVRMELVSDSKIAVISELIDILAMAGEVDDRVQVLQDVLDRENSMTTGMPDGIAIPHAKTTGVHAIKVVVARTAQGIDFQSMDGKPSHIFILIASPKGGEGPHLQVLSTISSVLKSAENRQAIMDATTPGEILRIFGVMPGAR